MGINKKIAAIKVSNSTHVTDQNQPQNKRCYTLLATFEGANKLRGKKLHVVPIKTKDKERGISMFDELEKLAITGIVPLKKVELYEIKSTPDGQESSVVIRKYCEPQ